MTIDIIQTILGALYPHVLFNCRLRATLRKFVPYLALLGQLTTDRREAKDFLKLSSVLLSVNHKHPLSL